MSNMSPIASEGENKWPFTKAASFSGIAGILLILFVTLCLTCLSENKADLFLKGLGVTVTFAAVYVALFKERILSEIFPVTVTLKLLDIDKDAAAVESGDKETFYYHVLVTNKSPYFIRNPRLLLVDVWDKGDRPEEITRAPLLLKEAHSQEVYPCTGFHKSWVFDLGQLAKKIGNGGRPIFAFQVGRGHRLRNNPMNQIMSGNTKIARLRFEADNLSHPCEQDFRIKVNEGETFKKDLVEVVKA